MLNFFQIPSDGRNLQTGTKIPRGPRLEHAEENHANYRKKNKVSPFYFLKIALPAYKILPQYLKIKMCKLLGF